MTFEIRDEGEKSITLAYMKIHLYLY
jgi:hypothetical protein